MPTRSVCAAVIALSVLLRPSFAVAQEERKTSGSIVWSAAKSVLFDPSTYAPAVISYKAQRLDWDTSQVLFQAGWVERNPRFTVSGRPNDAPISYAAGNRLIRQDAVDLLKTSLLNNVTVAITERALSARFPEHRKLFRVLGWIERISFASYVSYLASVEHFRQVDRNRQLAREHGYAP